jgi:hypothetical protein
MMCDSNKVVKRCECGTRLVGKFKELNLCATCHNTKIKNNHTNEICNNVQCQNKISRINLSLQKEMCNTIVLREKINDLHEGRNQLLIRLNMEQIHLSNLNDEFNELKNKYETLMKSETATIKVNELFDTLPEIKSQEICTDFMCSICLNLISTDEYIKHINCNHFYHDLCLYKHLHNSIKCPLCRDNITPFIQHDENTNNNISRRIKRRRRKHK